MKQVRSGQVPLLIEFAVIAIESGIRQHCERRVTTQYLNEAPGQLDVVGYEDRDIKY